MIRWNGFWAELRDVFNQGETADASFAYPRKREYWHTEGNFDFIGWLSAERRAAWRIQFFTRAFAAGVRKVCVMDASERERAAVRAYIQTLPQPFPMRLADTEVNVLMVKSTAFVHLDVPGPKPARCGCCGLSPARATPRWKSPLRATE